MSKIHVYIPCCSGTELGVPPNVELEESLLVVLVLPEVVSVDVITWVVSVGPSTGNVDMQKHQTSHPHTLRTIYFEFDTTHADGMHPLCLCIHITYTEYR